jgi:hypothetical protein
VYQDSDKTWAYVLTLLGPSKAATWPICEYMAYATHGDATGVEVSCLVSVYAEHFGLGGVPRPKKVVEVPAEVE